eukprot:1428106-Rhodomonas_salina.1
MTRAMQLQARALENTSHPLLADSQASWSDHSDPYTDPVEHIVGPPDPPSSDSSAYCSEDEPTEEQVPLAMRHLWPQIRGSLREATRRGGKRRTAEAVEEEARRRVWTGQMPPLPQL